MNKFIIPLGLIVLLVVASVSGAFWWFQNSKPVSTVSDAIRFVVPKGRNATQIAEELYKKGLIRNTLAFKFYVQLTGKSQDLQAGEFKVSPSFSLNEVVDALTSGPLELWVTIPEGLRREEIVEKFVTELEMDSSRAEFFKEEFLEASVEKEGYLFPDTYLFPRDVAGETVVSVMENTFEKKIEGEIRSNITSLSGTKIDEVVILASLLERETKTDAERPVVAGILLKRLKAGWPLQVDASVQYAVAIENCKLRIANCQWWPILTKEDLEINSPYNSYKFTGLPPAPISNPGLSSISAAALPQDSAYWYYIHDTDGKIHFARDLSEHNKNIREYLRK